MWCIGPHAVITRALCVQALFERAVSAKGTQQCALLWRAYIGYEHGRGRAEAARRVFLRAIHACPWSKACTEFPHVAGAVEHSDPPCMQMSHGA